MIYQLRITLSESEPPIWRRVAVDGRSSLGQLHTVIQIAMGWTDSHLHAFHVGGSQYGQHHPELDGWGPEMLDEERFALEQVAPAAGDALIYEYDFGDGWEHQVEVEEVGEPEAGVSCPRCLEGERSCPPEDVGGIWGYMEFLQAYLDKDHPEHATYVEWIGPGFDPGHFALDAVNKDLARLASLKVHSRAQPVSFTRRQGQYLAFIHYYTKVNGYPPAQTDIQRYFGVTGPSVHNMLKTLESRGLISKVAYEARSVRVLIDPGDLPDLA